MNASGAARLSLLAVGLACALLPSCAPLSAPVDVEVLLPDQDARGEFRLGTVTLHSVSDLYRGLGEDFDLRAGVNVNALTLVDELREERLDFAELVARGRRDEGSDVEPRLSFDGSRYVGDDFDSLQYLTVFHNFERAWSFAEAAGERSAATSTRGVVGFYGSLSLADALPVPLQTSDNAAYVTFIDGWMTFRILLAGGVPFSMNPGVIAHELHHRVFFHNVFGGAAFSRWRGWVTSPEVSRAGNLVKALDEGLADLFAVAMTRDLAFMSSSLTGALADEGPFRDLDGDLAREATYDALSASLLEQSVQEHCGFAREAGQDLFALDQFNFYCAGTTLARAVWEGAGEDFDVLERDVLPAVMRALPLVGARIAEESPSEQLVFDLDFFLDALASELAEERRPLMCSALQARFASLFEQGRVPACE